MRFYNPIYKLMIIIMIVLATSMSCGFPGITSNIQNTINNIAGSEPVAITPQSPDNQRENETAPGSEPMIDSPQSPDNNNGINSDPGSGDNQTIPEPVIVWSSGFESGNIQELEAVGGFIRQGSGSYHLVTPFAHQGKYSVGLTIDTSVPSNTGNHAAYLFYWDQLPGDAYYYSAWYFLPAGVHPGDWWNIWQWKSTYNGNTDNSEPLFDIGIHQRNGGNFLYFRDKFNPKNQDEVLQKEVPVPTDQWFKIEAFYKKAKDASGEIIVWQDGVELIRLTNVVTSLVDNTLYWSVNNYTDRIIPNPYTILIDDLVISRERLDPGS